MVGLEHAVLPIDDRLGHVGEAGTEGGEPLAFFGQVAALLFLGEGWMEGGMDDRCHNPREGVGEIKPLERGHS